ncbi:MAG: carotenoid biosynthesis protein [Tangfeifania sp.]
MVGITGFVVPQTHSFFKTLTPFALLMSAGFLAWFHHPAYTTKTLLIFAVIFLFSFLAEMVGVQTGSIFGHYIYGESLGLKILETPLIIGMNWLMLIYCTNIIAGHITNNETIKPFLGAFLMVVYDLVLEQAAPKLDMWSWEGGTIPLQNYVAWFVFAFFFHLLIRKAKVQFKNPLAIPVFVIQFLFFVALVVYFMTIRS